MSLLLEPRFRVYSEHTALARSAPEEEVGGSVKYVAKSVFGSGGCRSWTVL